jgi:hypothetical protein
MTALPEITDTYQFRVNLSCVEATDQAHRQRLLFEIIRSLLGLGTGWTNSNGTSITPTSPWSTYSSSDGVSADGTNRIEALADLVWAAEGNPHSWWQGVHDDYFGVGSPLYLLINCSQGGAHRNATLGVHLSRVPFSEGNASTRPTSAAEIEVLPDDGSMSTAPWQGDDGTTEDDRAGRLHCWLSTDGRHFRVIISRGSVDVAYWDLFRDVNYELAEWSHPVAMAIVSNDAGDSAGSAIDSLVNFAVFHTRDDVSVAAEFAMAPCMLVDGVTPIVSLDANSGTGDSGWDSIKLSARSPGAGLRSAIPNAWWGRTAEADSAHGDDLTFQQFYNLVFPWNGSVVQKA